MWFHIMGKMLFHPEVEPGSGSGPVGLKFGLELSQKNIICFPCYFLSTCFESSVAYMYNRILSGRIFCDRYGKCCAPKQTVNVWLNDAFQTILHTFHLFILQITHLGVRIPQWMIS